MLMLTLMRWNGVILRRNGLMARDPACCCGEGPQPVAPCCGRDTPGLTNSVGPQYYPLTLHCRITAGTCTYPSTAVDFDIVWDGSLELDWLATGVALGGAGTATIRLNCTSEGWSFNVEWTTCACGGISGCTTILTPVLNVDDECDPLDLSGTATMTGLMCCGNLGGGSILIEVWE